MWARIEDVGRVDSTSSIPIASLFREAERERFLGLLLR